MRPNTVACGHPKASEGRKRLAVSSAALQIKDGCTPNQLICGKRRDQEVMEQDEEPLAWHAKYEKIRDLGRGTFGFVQLARNR